MNNIGISCYHIENLRLTDGGELKEEDLRNYLEGILGYLEKDAWEISLVFTDDRGIREFNRIYRGKDEATDILSFCQEGEEGAFPGAPGGAGIPGLPGAPAGAGSFYPAGDLMISLETLGANAGEFRVSQEEELCRLLIHGVLHLAGWDHETNGEEEKMLILQEKILDKLGVLSNRHF